MPAGKVSALTDSYEKKIKHSTSSSPLLKACLRLMFGKFVNESDAKWIFLGSIKHFFLYSCQKCHGSN